MAEQSNLELLLPSGNQGSSLPQRRQTATREPTAILDWNTLDKVSDPICLIDMNSADTLACNVAYVSLVKSCTGASSLEGGARVQAANFLSDIVHPTDHTRIRAGITKLVASCVDLQAESVGLCRMKKAIRSNEWFDAEYRDKTIVVEDYRSIHVTLQRQTESAALVLCRIVATEVRVEHGHRRIWELSTSELTGFFEEIRAPFYVIGVDGYILWLNRAGYEIFGYLREEMLNHRLEDFCLNRHDVGTFMGMILDGNNVEDVSLDLLYKQGEHKSISFHLTPCYVDGALCKFSMLGLDEKPAVDKGGFPLAAAVVTHNQARDRLLSTSRPINVVYIDESNIESLKKLWVLLTDDSTLCLKMMRRVLESFGFDCDEADTGLAAVNKIKDNPGKFDCILIDLRMPVMDGITATKIIREELGYKKTMIALTAECDRDILTEVLRAGCNDYITKPARVQVILNILRKYGLYGTELLTSR